MKVTKYSFYDYSAGCYTCHKDWHSRGNSKAMTAARKHAESTGHETWADKTTCIRFEVK